jgi:hypothetical protein
MAERAMAGSRHSKPAIEEVLQYAESRGWRVEKARGGQAHIWGTIYCPHSARDGCMEFVRSTPRNPEAHAAKLRRKIDDCPHVPANEQADDAEQ